MKKIILLLTVAGCLVMNMAMAQKKITEGTITYSIDVNTDNEQLKQGLANSSMVVKFKPGKSMTESKTGAFMTLHEFTNKELKNVAIQIDVMGQKKQVNMTEKEYKEQKKQLKGKTKIDYVDGAKTIAGYNCKKAIVTINDSVKTTVWYTPDLEINTSTGMAGGFDDIKGFVMSFEMMQNGLTLIYTVTGIDTTAVGDDVFKVPAGYDQMTFEEYKKMFGQR